MKKALSWTVVSVGILEGIFGLVILDRHWEYRARASDWSFLAAATLFGFVPLVGSALATRSRRRAGFLFLGASPLSLAAFFLAGTDLLHYDLMRRDVLLAYSFGATLIVFILPGLFWLATQKANWPLLTSRSLSLSSKRNVLRFSGTCTLLLGLLIIGIVANAAFSPPDFPGDCDKWAPILPRFGPRQEVFVVKVITTVGPCLEFRDAKACRGAIAMVKERFAGTHSDLVLLTEGYFEKGEEYLIDGDHYANGPLTRFLPIVGFRRCTRSAHLRDAGLDLRILRDGPPRNGVRILGTVKRYNGTKRDLAPATQVLITGPAGTLSVLTDTRGVYDVIGLPPGHYEIHTNPRGLLPWDSQCWNGIEIKSGDVGGCALYID